MKNQMWQDFSPRAHYRRDILLGCLLTSVIIVIIALNQSESWAGWLPALIAATHNNATVIGGVIGASLFSWTSSGARALHSLDAYNLSSRSRWQLVQGEVLAALIYSVTITVVPTVALIFLDLLRLNTHDAANSLWTYLVYFVGTAAYIFAIMVMSIIIGRVAPAIVSPLLSAVVAYLVVWLPVSSAAEVAWGEIAAFTTMAWNWVWIGPVENALRTLFWVAVSFLLIVVAAKRARLITSFLLAASLILAMSILYTRADPAPVPVPRAQECNANKTLCVAYQYAAGIPRYEAIGKEILQRIPESVRPRTILVYSPDTEVITQDSPLPLSARGRTNTETNLPNREWSIYATFLNYMVPLCTSSSSFVRSYAILDSTLLRFGFSLADLEASDSGNEIPLDMFTGNDLRRFNSIRESFSAMTDEEFSTWLEDHWTELPECGISDEDLP